MSALTAWLNTAPIWLLGLIVLSATLLCAWGGFLMRREATRRSAVGGADYDDAYEGYIVSGVLGLLALLMGFTFSMAVDRFDTRRSLVLDEANTIGTTYLRTQLLEEPHRARITGLLIDYAENRVYLASLNRPGVEAPERMERNDALITELWTATASAFQTIKGMDFSTSYLETMNALIDLDTSRKMARIVRVPLEVFVVLTLYMFVAAAVMGFVLVGRQGQWAGMWLIVLLTMALMLIFDIDRPGRGGITESQRPMEMLLASMKNTPSSTYDRYRLQDARAGPVAATASPGG